MIQNRGITLITLIATIIILLILSAVSIGVAVDGELFNRTRKTMGEVNNNLEYNQGKLEGIVGVWNNIQVGINLEDNTPNIGPVIETIKFSDKTADTITVKAKAIDENKDNLTYTIYTSTSQEGPYTPKEISSGNIQNTEVILSAEDLLNYTTYWWYIEVSDGKSTVKSSTQSVKTYCLGTGLMCNTSTCNGIEKKNCLTCNGTGTISTNCTGGTITKCSICNGSGSTICGRRIDGV